MTLHTTLLQAAAAFTSVTRPQGPAAAHINELWWVMFWIATVVCVVVFVLLVLAVVRPRGAQRSRPLSERFVVISGALIPAVILVGLLAYSLGTNRVLAAPGEGEALTVEVIGHQWWWEVRYPESGVVTANEVVIPVGQQVRLELTSVDVIHSFWVPSFYYKLDVIPGHPNSFDVTPNRLGVYDGKCAELCGTFHSLMLFEVHVVPEDEYNARILELAENGQAGSLPLPSNEENTIEMYPNEGDQ